jgi:hypothetical protein
LPNIARFIRNGRVGYSAQDVIDVLMSKLSTA